MGFIQLFFVLNSIWSSQIYYMYGFLFLVFIILIITCSETTILLCYFHLCAEDYHWWWRSFLTSGFTAFYLAVYCIHYFITKLDIVGSASTFLLFHKLPCDSEVKNRRGRGRGCHYVSRL